MFSKSVILKKYKDNENNNNINLNYCIKTDNNINNNIINKNIINIELSDKINQYKNDLFNNKVWNEFRKISNNYELVNIILNNRNLGLSLLRPLSRSYYKIIEIIKDYKLLDNLNKNFSNINKIVLIAEAPGGFLEALNDKIGDNTNYYAISLIKENNNNIPNWEYAKKKYSNNNNIHFLLGKDKTGDLYKLINIFNYIDKIGSNSVELITSDGGLDFSEDYLNQEQLFYRLFLCEVTLALSIQKKNGIFICKIFDFNTTITIKIIYLLYLFYDEVIITKPNISRKANSEKYLICKNFKKELPNDILKNFYKIILSWNNNIIDIFNFDIPEYFLKNIENYNTIFLEKQIKHFEYIKDLYLTLTKKKLFKIINDQILYSYNWCLNYDISIDTHNIYLNYDINYIVKHYYAYLLLFKYEKLKN
tara:strand:- start:406 stop:1668 length:1263 start_codon:yes stop_codon:yes gene_type:complete